jgi:hypothetical protein
MEGFRLFFCLERACACNKGVLRGTEGSWLGNREFWRGTNSILRETPFTLRERVTDK